MPTHRARFPTDVSSFDCRLDAAHRAIDRLSDVKGPRTIENTLVPFDDAIRQIDTANNFAFLMQEVHPDASFRDHATAMNTKADGALSSLALNRDVYVALAKLDLSRTDPQTRY